MGEKKKSRARWVRRGVLPQALAKFVPPPRVHRRRYHGVRAPNARLRPQVVALGRPELVSEEPAAEGDVASPNPSA